jgi:hypothetical protein
LAEEAWQAAQRFLWDRYLWSRPASRSRGRAMPSSGAAASHSLQSACRRGDDPLTQERPSFAGTFRVRERVGDPGAGGL